MSNFLLLAEPQSAARPGEFTLCVRHGRCRTPIPAFPSSRCTPDQLENYMGPVLAIATLLGVFAVAALLLASIGLYAVIAFHLSRRKRELGIRMALGASSQQILQRRDAPSREYCLA